MLPAKEADSGTLDDDTLSIRSFEKDNIGNDSYLYCTPATRCLAPLASKPGYLCLGRSSCRTRGHFEAREEEPPIPGFRRCEYDSDGKVSAIRADILLTEDEFQAKRDKQRELDLEAVANLGSADPFSPYPAGESKPSPSQMNTTRAKTRPPQQPIFSPSPLVELPEPSRTDRPSSGSTIQQLIQQNQELVAALTLQTSRTAPPSRGPPSRTRAPILGCYAIGPDCTIPGIYHTLTEVKEILAMDPTKRATVRRFPSESIAQNWLDHQFIMQENEPVPAPESPALRPSASINPTRPFPTARENVEQVRRYYDDRPVDEIQKEVAVDTSRGKESAAFGATIISEQDAEELLSPSDLTEADSIKLRGKILDATALPNLALPTSSEAEESLVASSLLLVAQAHNTGVTRDPQVHLPKRTALYSVKTLGALQRLSKHLQKSSERAQQSTTGSMARVFMEAGVPKEFAPYRAMKCLAHRVSVEALRYYQELVTHLLEQNSLLGWDSALAELTYHADEISGIRTSTNNRTYALLSIYIHLRNGSHSRWQSSRLLSARVDALVNLKLPNDIQLDPTATHPTESLSTTSGLQQPCTHCGSRIHPSDITCPFKRLKKDKARKAAKAYQKKLYEEAIKAAEEEGE